MHWTRFQPLLQAVDAHRKKGCSKWITLLDASCWYKICSHIKDDRRAIISLSKYSLWSCRSPFSLCKKYITSDVVECISLSWLAEEIITDASYWQWYWKYIFCHYIFQNWGFYFWSCVLLDTLCKVRHFQMLLQFEAFLYIAYLKTIFWVHGASCSE